MHTYYYRKWAYQKVAEFVHPSTTEARRYEAGHSGRACLSICPQLGTTWNLFFFFEINYNTYYFWSNILYVSILGSGVFEINYNIFDQIFCMCPSWEVECYLAIYRKLANVHSSNQNQWR